jgi:hypothetical protein
MHTNIWTGIVYSAVRCFILYSLTHSLTHCCCVIFHIMYCQMALTIRKAAVIAACDQSSQSCFQTIRRIIRANLNEYLKKTFVSQAVGKENTRCVSLMVTCLYTVVHMYMYMVFCKLFLCVQYIYFGVILFVDYTHVQDVGRSFGMVHCSYVISPLLFHGSTQ